MPMAASTEIRNITTISSIIVKPRLERVTGFTLPVLVVGAIEGLAVEGGENVEHVLAAPAGRVRFVLVRAHAPLRAARHRVDRNVPEILELAPRGVVRRRH